MTEPVPKTLLAVFAHPDDELGAAGSLLAQRARGDRVVVLYLTRGESTAAFGPLARSEVARRREAQAARAAELLGVEHRFLDLPDGGVTATPEAGYEVARVISEVQPDGLITWGDAWVQGMRHPDHRACGMIARDALTYARMAALVRPLEPHRAFCPVFTLRDVHSRLPCVTLDVEPHLERILELAAFHHELIGFGDRAWLEARLSRAGRDAGIRWGEAFDAWESAPGTVLTLLPARPLEDAAHPTRSAPVP